MEQNAPQPNASQPNQQQLQIRFHEDKVKGDYSNMVQMLHTKEEFVMDYLSAFPPQGVLVSRVIVSPSHFKRMVAAMMDNLKKYEATYGEIKEAQEPKNNFGF